MFVRSISRLLAIIAYRARRFWRLKDGVAAIEFAIVGPLHLAMLLSMTELGFVLTRTALLDDAVSKSAKFVYIGAASGEIITQSDIESFICDNIRTFFRECDGDVSVELTPITDFSSLPAASAQCRDDSGEVNIDPAVQFKPGSANTIVFMRVCATTDIIVPGLGMGLQMARTATGRYQMISSIAFVNEPF